MASDVSICNAALLKLGAEPILTLNDNNNRARVLNQRYTAVRDAELYRRRWRFSIQRASLPALATAPISDYPYAYQLPDNFLRLIEGGDIRSISDLSDFQGGCSELYSVEGTSILTFLTPPLNIRFIARITDAALFHAAFDESFASRLAYECCEKITQSDSKRQLATLDYKTAIQEAVRAQAIEVASQSQADDTWVTARLS